MNQAFLTAISNLIDAKVELAIAIHAEKGGHTYDDDDPDSCSFTYEERKVKEAENALTQLITKPQPRAFPESGMVLDIQSNRASVIQDGKVVETRERFM